MAAAMEEEREAEQAARQGQQVQIHHYCYICLCPGGPMEAQQVGEHLREEPETQVRDSFLIKANCCKRSIMCLESSWV